MPRHRQYDEDEVLIAAMRVFWADGYGASTRRLADAMGINHYSVYASFESKVGLFAKALERYIDDIGETLGLENVVLVLHDKGGGIGFDYAMRMPENVRGIAFMEAVVRPSRWEDANAVGRYLSKNLRDEEQPTGNALSSGDAAD